MKLVRQEMKAGRDPANSGKRRLDDHSEGVDIWIRTRSIKSSTWGHLDYGMAIKKMPAAYYTGVGFSSHAAEILATVSRVPLDEFYWLDKKWWSFYTANDKRTCEELLEFLGGAFYQLSLADQCELLDVPIFAPLAAPCASDRGKTRWVLDGELCTAEAYVARLLNKHYAMVVADEGRHLTAWLIWLLNIYEESCEEGGYPDSVTQSGEFDQVEFRKHFLGFVRTHSKIELVSAARSQIQLQIDGSWWGKGTTLDEAITALETWSIEAVLKIEEQNVGQGSCGKPDITLFDGVSHYLVEVKTTDKLHQSQAEFIRRSMRQVPLDIRVVQLRPLTTGAVTNTDDFVEWLKSGI